jgi:hypothetical protein
VMISGRVFFFSCCRVDGADAAAVPLRPDQHAVSSVWGRSDGSVTDQCADVFFCLYFFFAEFTAPTLLQYRFDLTNMLKRFPLTRWSLEIERRLRRLPADHKARSLLVTYAIPRSGLVVRGRRWIIQYHHPRRWTVPYHHPVTLDHRAGRSRSRGDFAASPPTTRREACSSPTPCPGPF